MSSFTDELVVKKISGRLWETTRAFQYYVGEEGSTDVVSVPEGFQTDFASVPRIFWSILPPDGNYTQAAVLHDYLYSTQERSRSMSDYIFLEAMQVLGVPAYKRQIMYRAVKWFGWIVWKKRKKDS